MSDIKTRSWSVPMWPADVYPNTPTRARRVLRQYRNELMACGALARIGRELIVFAEPYSKWVRSKASAVAGFKIAPNEKRVANDITESAA